MNKILLTLCCCLLLLLAACAAPAGDNQPPEEAAPGPTEPAINYGLEIDTAGIELWAKWPEGRPAGTIHIYNNQPLQDLATQYIEAYGQAWLAASAEQPDDALAISACKLAAPPVVTYAGSLDSQPFIFTCYVEHAFQPLHYQQYTNTGGTHPYEEEGWLVTPFVWKFAVAEDGRVTDLPGSTDGVYLNDGYVPLELIRKAQEIYGWFALDTSSLIDQEQYWQMVNYQGNIYSPSRFATLAELEAQLRQYFGAELTASLLAEPCLAEIEGQLYVIDAGRGSNLAYEGERWRLTEAGPDKFVYTVEVDYLFPEEPEENRWTESFQYVLEYQDGTGWVFTRFGYYL